MFRLSDNMHSESYDDCDAMRITFEKFMMGKEGHQDEENNTNEKTQAKEGLIKRIDKKRTELNRAEKRYWQMFRNFFDLVQDEWMDIDDQLEHLINSIRDIRNHLPIGSCLLERMNIEKKRREQVFYGNKQLLMRSQLKVESTGDIFLKGEDVQLAMSYDLLQHKRMMECLRSVFANFSDCHEALSRNLDGIMKHHLKFSAEIMSFSAKPHISCGLEKTIDVMNSLNDLFRALSMELYQKQVLVNLVFESVTNDLFSKDSLIENGDTNIIDFDLETPGPRKTMFEISKRWPRVLKWSHINVPEFDRLFVLVGSNQ